MRILITGGAGYLGSVTAMTMVNAGHTVAVLDDLSYGTDAWHTLRMICVKCINGDVCDSNDMARAFWFGPDVVVHLASIVGDPECAKYPEKARKVNVDATIAMIDEANAEGAFSVFASSCSVYGRNNEVVDEDSEKNPVSLYARQKLEVEDHILKLNGPRASILRFATLHGLSPKMRWDLTVNEFARDFFLGRTVEVYGEQFYRPYCHITDAARTIEWAARSGQDKAIYNVGADANNHAKGELARSIREEVNPAAHIKMVHKDEDPRDYRVRFKRLWAETGACRGLSVRHGAREIAIALAAARSA